MTPRQKLEALEQEISNVIQEIRTSNPLITLNTIEDVEDDAPDYYEVRNDMTGNVWDCHILSINANGIVVADANDYKRIHTIGLSDLCSTMDRINLLETLQQKINEIPRD